MEEHDSEQVQGEAQDAEPEEQPASQKAAETSQPELSGELWGPLEPPAEGVEEVAPGVLKLVLQPGLGEKPKLYARCLGAQGGQTANRAV